MYLVQEESTGRTAAIQGENRCTDQGRNHISACTIILASMVKLIQCAMYVFCILESRLTMWYPRLYLELDLARLRCMNEFF